MEAEASVETGFFDLDSPPRPLSERPDGDLDVQRVKTRKGVEGRKRGR